MHASGPRGYAIRVDPRRAQVLEAGSVAHSGWDQVPTLWCRVADPATAVEHSCTLACSPAVGPSIMSVEEPASL